MDNNSQQTTEPQITPEPMQQSELIQPIPETPSTTPFEPQKPAKKSKKKLIIILIIIAILLIGGGVVAFIMVKPKPAPGRVEAEAEAISNKSTVSEKSSSGKSVIPATYEYRTPVANAKFAIPYLRFNNVQRGDCHVLSYYEGTDRPKLKYIIAIHNNHIAADVKNEDINDFLFKMLAAQLGGDMDDLIKISSENSSSKIINGFSTLKFEGSAILADVVEKEYSVYSVGYAFSVEGIPMQVIGFVVDRDQPQAYEAMIEKDIDEIMSTIKLAK